MSVACDNQDTMADDWEPFCTDWCERCYKPTKPSSWGFEGTGRFITHYVCCCGHDWATSWTIDLAKRHGEEVRAEEAESK